MISFNQPFFIPSSRRRPGPISPCDGCMDQVPVVGRRYVPAFASIGFTHLWPATSRPSTAHTPLAREAGRGRGPLRSNGRVRGVPVTSFLAVPRSQTAAIFTSRSALSDRAPLTLPTLMRWAPPSPRCRGARCIGDSRTCPQRCMHTIAAFAGMTEIWPQEQSA